MSRFFRHALGCLLLAAFASVASAQRGSRPPARYLQGKPDQARGAEVLQELRATGIAGTYYFDFELVVRPLRGKETRVPGHMWGGRTNEGPVSRVSIAVGGGRQRLLVRTGPDGRVWSWKTGQLGPPLELTGAALFEPFPGTDLTPFDLQMPFQFWSEFEYEGLARKLNRPAHQFLLYPPAGLSESVPSLAGIRLYVDAATNAPLQIEHLGAGERILKTWTVGDIKPLNGTWFPIGVRVANNLTRGHTLYSVRGAAIGETFPSTLFDPADLVREASPPPPSRVTLFGR